MINLNAEIAAVMGVSPNQIKSIKEMAWVYCVVVKGSRATFVSKKSLPKTPKINEESIEEISWMIDLDSAKESGNWTVFKLNGDYYPRDIFKSVSDQKNLGFAVFYDKTKKIVGVLTKQFYMD